MSQIARVSRGLRLFCLALDVTPHVAQNLKRRGGSAIDARTTRHAGYAKSLHARRRVEPASRRTWRRT